MIPTFILQTWLLGLLSVGIISAAFFLGREWQARSWGWDPILQQSVFAPHFGWNETTGIFAAAVLLGSIALLGGPMVKLALRLFAKRTDATGIDPYVSPVPTSTERLHRPDGSELHVEFHGAPDSPPIVLTHGWGLHSAEWNFLKRELSSRFRLIVWDEQGLGKSTRPANRDFSLENFARNLDAVLDLAGPKPAILLGHSIGGMTTLTFCRLFKESLGERVIGLILAHTTPVNPVRTTKGAAFYSAIEKPVLVPLMYLTIALSPVVWLLNWLSYFNGSAHLSTKRSSFGGTETWDQIDFAAKFQPKASPAVLARGMLGVMHYDATSVLSEIMIPTLVVSGDQDGTTKPEASEMIRHGIPKAKLVTLAPAKHLGLIEHHARFAALVQEFAFATNAEHTQRKTSVASATTILTEIAKLSPARSEAPERRTV